MDHDLAVLGRVTAYLDRLLDRVGERVAERVVDRLEATLDVMTDRALLDDLARADQEPDDDAVPFDDVRRVADG